MDDVFKPSPAQPPQAAGRLSTGRQTLGELCERVDMTRFGVMKHLRVLEERAPGHAPAGARKLHYLNPMPIPAGPRPLVSKYRAPFAAALSDHPNGPTWRAHAV